MDADGFSRLGDHARIQENDLSSNKACRSWSIGRPGTKLASTGCLFRLYHDFRRHGGPVPFQVVPDGGRDDAVLIHDLVMQSCRFPVTMIIPMAITTNRQNGRNTISHVDLS
jgi:hypothetical protein